MSKKLSLVLVLCFLLVPTIPVLAEWGVISAGARQHVDHSMFAELPFDDGDLSYGLAYEWHEDAGYWQIAAYYTPEAGGAPSADYVITPQINLIFKDNIWRGGVGALSNYIPDETAEDDWTDIYWQLILGVNLPMFGVQLDLHAYYVFEEWKEVDEFDTDDIEFGVWLNYSF